MGKSSKNKSAKRRQDTKEWRGFLELPEHGDPQSVRAVEAFNYGNFKLARQLCLDMLKSPDAPKQSKAIARSILRRTDTDYRVLWAAVAAVLVVLFIFFWAINYSH